MKYGSGMMGCGGWGGSAVREVARSVPAADSRYQCVTRAVARSVPAAMRPVPVCYAHAGKGLIGDSAGKPAGRQGLPFYFRQGTAVLRLRGSGEKRKTEHHRKDESES